MFAIWIFASWIGCSPDPFDGAADDLVGTLGDWADADLSCDNDDDCFVGETCISNTCQVERCAVDILGSRPPLGQGLTFLQEHELGLADVQAIGGTFWLDAYHPQSGANAFDFSVEVGTSSPIDVAGGNFDGSTLESYGLVTEGHVLTIPSLDLELDTEARPIALASGDTDGDGLDEALVLTEDEKLLVCHVDEGLCDFWGVKDKGNLVDVAVADLDGDGFAEPVVLSHRQGNARLYAFRTASDVGPGPVDWFGVVGDDSITRISSGDVEGDFRVEIVALADGGCSQCSDSLVLIDPRDDGSWEVRYSSELDGVYDAIDMVAGDTDGDDRIEVATLTSEPSVVIEVATDGTFLRSGSGSVGISLRPQRIAMADHDGDAPRARLAAGPERVQGKIIPLMAMVLPPYHRDYSDGVSSVSFGDSESLSETLSDTVSLGVGADIGTKPSFFGLFGIKLSAKVDRRVSTTTANTNSISVGSRYSLAAEPGRFGPNYGGVVIGWGCFDAYEYVVDDAADLLADGDSKANGEPIVVTVPVGGGEALYSSRRYNAMAGALALPLIDFDVSVGDPASYPSRPRALDGSPLGEEDLLFPSPDSYVVSDAGKVGWRNSVGKSESNSTKVSTSLGAAAGIEVFGVAVGGSTFDGWGNGYSLKVGSAAQFIGSLPPLPDDPSTPEDEYAAYGYSVTPWVYQHSYEDADGNEGAYWVMTYSVGD